MSTQNLETLMLITLKFCVIKKMEFDPYTTSTAYVPCIITFTMGQEKGKLSLLNAFVTCKSKGIVDISTYRNSTHRSIPTVLSQQEGTHNILLHTIVRESFEAFRKASLR